MNSGRIDSPPLSTSLEHRSSVKQPVGDDPEVALVPGAQKAMSSGNEDAFVQTAASVRIAYAEGLEILSSSPDAIDFSKGVDQVLALPEVKGFQSLLEKIVGNVALELEYPTQSGVRFALGKRGLVTFSDVADEDTGKQSYWSEAGGRRKSTIDPELFQRTLIEAISHALPPAQNDPIKYKEALRAQLVELPEAKLREIPGKTALPLLASSGAAILGGMVTLGSAGPASAAILGAATMGLGMLGLVALRKLSRVV